jgi:hypothetical protein
MYLKQVSDASRAKIAPSGGLRQFPRVFVDQSYASIRAACRGNDNAFALGHVSGKYSNVPHARFHMPRWHMTGGRFHVTRLIVEEKIRLEFA